MLKKGLAVISVVFSFVFVFAFNTQQVNAQHVTISAEEQKYDMSDEKIMTYVDCKIAIATARGQKELTIPFFTTNNAAKGLGYILTKDVDVIDKGGVKQNGQVIFFLKIALKK